jgi:hypothetical protein
MTQQRFHRWVQRNYPGGPEPKRLTVIETPRGSVKADKSEPSPPPGNGHLPPNTPGAKIVAEYEITYNEWGKATFKKLSGTGPDAVTLPDGTP